MSGKWPLFWCLKAEQQAKLMQFYYDKYGEILNIPKPTQTSNGVWQSVQLENLEEIERIMKRPPKHQKRVV